MPLDILKEVATPVAIVLIFVVYLYRRDIEEAKARNAMIRDHQDSLKTIISEMGVAHKDKTVAFLESENKSKELIENLMNGNKNKRRR